MEMSQDQMRQLHAALDELHAIIDEYQDDSRLLRVYARLANALYEVRADGDDVVGWAVDAFQKVVARISPTERKAWAQTHLDLGDAWRGFSIYPCDRAAATARAVAAYEAAAAGVTPETDAEVWAHAQVKLAAAHWIATDYFKRAEAAPHILARLQHLSQSAPEHREALQLIREILVDTADVPHWREAYDRELAVVGRYKDDPIHLRDWATVMQSKAADLSSAAERQQDLWLLTESDKVIAEALATIEAAPEGSRAAAWEEAHYLQRSQQLNDERRKSMSGGSRPR
ncbi:MAG TPA: hypothetical protein VI072_35890 [Polyangiaceae bacterium]